MLKSTSPSVFLFVGTKIKKGGGLCIGYSATSLIVNLNFLCFENRVEEKNVQEAWWQYTETNVRFRRILCLKVEP